MRLSAVLFVLMIFPVTAEAKVEFLQYPGFFVWLDCKTGQTQYAIYEIGPDTGNEERSHTFFLDPDLPQSCKQQTSTDSYKAPETAPYKYDRGHLVPANHLDHDKELVKATNVMTNIVPQHRSFNRTGAWRETEKRIECWRDEGLVILIAVDWGSDESNDHFVESHGIATPDRFVKIVYSKKRQAAIAWGLENGPIKAADLDNHIVPPIEFKNVTGTMPGFQGVDVDAKADAADWPKLTCDQS